MSRERNLADRFWNKVNKTDGCWEWGANRNPSGYGRFRLNGRMEVAHRVGYSLAFGQIPDGLFILHSCDNPPCVNPSHLRAGTKADNMRDMVQRGRNSNWESSKTHCKRGHPYDEANTRINRNGSRSCRACGRAYKKRDWDKKQLLKEQA